MRLTGLAAGIATFAVLEITNNILQYYEKIGPGQNTFSAVPETTGVWQAAVGALVAVAAAFVYQRSRFGRMLRAVREDAPAAAAAGISIYRQRLGAFVLSGLVAGFAGGLEVHLLPLSYRDLYLDLTFLTLAMLVLGGAGTIGSLFAGHLAQVADVTVLTRRPEHAQALNEHGLRVSGRSDFAAAVDASSDPATLGDADLVILACKGGDLEPLAASL